MIKEQAIVHTLNISRIGERVSFQVSLPQDTRRIIGLEYDTRKSEGEPYISRFPFGAEGDTDMKRYPNHLIGRLTLKNSYCEGIIYQGNLIEDRNTRQYEGVHAQIFTTEPWVFSKRREEISLSAKGGVIEGFYEDHYGKSEYISLIYELYLYIWIEKCKV